MSTCAHVRFCVHFSLDERQKVCTLVLMSAINSQLTRTLITTKGLRMLGVLTALEKSKLPADQNLTNPEMLEVAVMEACERRGLDPKTLQPVSSGVDQPAST